MAQEKQPLLQKKITKTYKVSIGNGQSVMVNAGNRTSGYNSALFYIVGHYIIITQPTRNSNDLEPPLARRAMEREPCKVLYR